MSLQKQDNTLARNRRGFTIVELLIVIVVIAILAAISVVAFTGVQQRARDAQRSSDVTTISKALEMYYLDNGRYPASGGSTAINATWSTTADSSWQNLEDSLVPEYIAELPSDPTSTADSDVTASTDGFNYAYYATGASDVFCDGATNGRMYILVYRLEASDQVDRFSGSCTNNGLAYSNASNIRHVH